MNKIAVTMDWGDGNMTRLNTSDIDRIKDNLQRNDRYWKQLLNYKLEEIAKKAVNVSDANTVLKTAVIPVTSGLGIIGGFCEAVKEILDYCGADAFITDGTDVAGILEACRKTADIIFMADDNVCAAFSMQGNVYSDNGYATGIGFAAALEIMMKKAEREKVLILGAGPVGTAAAQYFSARGAIPVLCDILTEKAIKAASSIRNAEVEKDIAKIKSYRYILDATNSGDFIKARDVTEDTRISAPGMPLGVSEEVSGLIPVFHNPLELGIMTMYFDCVKQLEERKSRVGTD